MAVVDEVFYRLAFGQDITLAQLKDARGGFCWDVSDLFEQFGHDGLAVETFALPEGFEALSDFRTSRVLIGQIALRYPG